jgi:hypothetical protein
MRATKCGLSGGVDFYRELEMIQTSYVALGEKLDRKAFRDAIARHLGNQTRSISIGRSLNVAGFSNSTPIEVVDGDSPPELAGRPYLSTTFRRGSFTKNMYTPSTLHVVVGRDWNGEAK